MNNNDFEVNESTFLIRRYLKNSSSLLFHIREENFNDWIRNNDKKNIFDYLIENNLDLPDIELYFPLISKIDKKNFKSFVNFIEYSESKGLDLQYISKSENNYSKEYNFFEYSVYCANEKVALFFYKKNVKPNLEVNGYSNIRTVLEHGLFDVLKIYKKLGLSKLENEYGYHGLIHYVGISGSVIETLRTDENLNRSLLRLEKLKKDFSDLLPESISQYDVKVLDFGINYLEDARNQLTSRDKKVAKFFYQYIEEFTNGQYSKKPCFVKHGKNYLLKNDDRNNEDNITNVFLHNYFYHFYYSSYQDKLLYPFKNSNSKSPFSFLNKIDVPAPSNFMIRKMQSFVQHNPEHLSFFISYLTKIKNQGVNISEPLIVPEKNEFVCYNELSLLDVAKSYENKEMIKQLKPFFNNSKVKNKIKL